MTYYDILELAPHSSLEVIKNAYRALAKKYHPDTQPDQNARQWAESTFKQISEAYEVLSDVEKRKAYDEWLNINNSQELYEERTVFAENLKKAETSDDLININKTRKKPRFRKALIIGLAITAAIVIGLIIFESYQVKMFNNAVTAKEESLKESVQNDIVTVGDVIVSQTYETVLSGTLINNSTTIKYSYFLIDCKVYDKANVLLETVTISVSNIEPGEKVKFTHSASARLEDIASVKVTNIRFIS